MSCLQGCRGQKVEVYDEAQLAVCVVGVKYLRIYGKTCRKKRTEKKNANEKYYFGPHALFDGIASTSHVL